MNPAVIRKAGITGKCRVGVLVRTPVRLVELSSTADTNMETRGVLSEDIPVAKVIGLKPRGQGIGRQVSNAIDAGNPEVGTAIKITRCVRG